MQTIGIIKNVTFGLRGNPPSQTILFEIHTLKSAGRPYLFSFSGDDMNKFLTEWNVVDLRVLERMPVIVIEGESDNINLIGPFIA